MRLELAAALSLGVVLVAGGLYLWRRPHTAADGVAVESALPPAAGTADDAAAPVASADAGHPPPVILSDARTVACHDRGPRKTPSDQCDHLSPIEKALASAVERSAGCVSQGAGTTRLSRATGGGTGSTGTAGATGGTIEYVADVSFLRHKVSVLLPRAGRSVHDPKVLAACVAAVRGALDGLPLDGVDHRHARYRISVTATYPVSTHGG